MICRIMLADFQAFDLRMPRDTGIHRLTAASYQKCVATI
jgi:hypothetical protein